MKHYLLATQQSWGRKVFDAVMRPSERWDRLDTRERWVLRAVLKSLRPRYAFFINWSDFVPLDVLAMTECVNFHCTALPYGRGGGPIENLLLRGHTETVITAHRMVKALDAGPVYDTRGPVSLAGTKAEILDRFVEPVVDLIRWIVDTEPPPYPQMGEPTTFTRLPKAEMEALWARRAS